MLKRLIKQLKLSSVEERIIARLERSPYILTASGLALELHLPRRTVGYNLISLRNRGLAQRDSSNRYPEWSLAALEARESSVAETYSGTAEIQKKIWSLLQAPGLTRYYTIQGTASIRDQFRLYDSEFARSVHRFVKKRKIIIEGVISNSGLSEMDRMNIDQLRSHKDRLTVVYVLADEILNFEHDFYIFDSKLCLVNYRKQSLVVINDAAISSGVYSLLRMAILYGKKINLNDHINNLITEAEKARI